MAYCAAGAGAALAGGAIVRLLAPGDFGLEGAASPGAYGRVSRYDLGLYMKTLELSPIGRPGGGHWYLPPDRVASRFAAVATGAPAKHAHWLVLALLGGVALWLVVRRPDRLRPLALSSVIFVLALAGIALAFDWHYRVYIPATFGYRRLMDYAPVSSALVALAGLEAGVLVIARSRRRAAVVAVALVAIALAVVTLPGAAISPEQRAVSERRLALVNWVRTRLPCDARLLVNARPESPFQALTGRAALTEGMGPFLRVEKLAHIATLFRQAVRFYRHPAKEQSFITRERVTDVIVQRARKLHIGPESFWGNRRAFEQTRFLRLVYRSGGANVYEVLGRPTRRASPLLRGPYLHCERTPARF
jgi:hypothetical protein